MPLSFPRMASDVNGAGGREPAFKITGDAGHRERVRVGAGRVGPGQAVAAALVPLGGVDLLADVARQGDLTARARLRLEVQMRPLVAIGAGKDAGEGDPAGVVGGLQTAQI